MQCEQTVLLYEVVQIDTQRPQPVSVGYGRTGHGALPYSVQSRHNHVGIAKHWRAHSEGRWRHSTWQLKPSLTPILKQLHTKQTLFLPGRDSGR